MKKSPATRQINKFRQELSSKSIKELVQIVYLDSERYPIAKTEVAERILREKGISKKEILDYKLELEEEIVNRKQSRLHRFIDFFFWTSH